MEYVSKFKSSDMDELFKAVLSLENEEECYRFFEDICTINELKSIAQRLQVAKMLYEKKTYNEIEEVTIGYIPAPISFPHPRKMSGVGHFVTNNRVY